MKPRFPLLHLALCLTFLTSCASGKYTYGRDFDAELVGQIEKGVTTQAQILETFGDPTDQRFNADGALSWTYTYTEGQSQVRGFSVATNSTMKTLSLTFRDSVVTDFFFHQGDGPSSTNTSSKK
ncbi:MAG: hypothetical protein HQ519_04030 [Planctomycetes bacterium]|nr:hypothetical protein [Planctomycetota bacterium]